MARKLLIGLFVSFQALGVELAQDVSVKTDVGRTVTDGLISSDDVPQFVQTYQWQATAKFKPQESTFFLIDSSLLGLILENFDGEKNGTRADIEKPMSDRRKGKISLNEIYGVYEPLPSWSLTFGRKRITWGSGYFKNPTDLINPSKNILDPTAARKGTFLGSVDYRKESSTWTILKSGVTREKENGIPDQIYEVEGKTREMTAARYWTLLGTYDLSIMRLDDNGYTKPGVRDIDTGVSVSGLVVDALEVHGEALLKSAKGQKDYILGFGYTFSNESTLTLEYLHNDLGQSASEFASLAKKLYVGKKLGQRPSGNSDENLTGKLYLKDHFALGLQRYKYNDDVFFTFNTLINPVHRAAAMSPGVNWMARDWLSLTLVGFYNKSFSGAKLPDGSKVSEQDLFPMPLRTSFEIKAYF